MEKGIVFICTVCGRDCFYDKKPKVKGSMKHPICEECFKNPKKKKIWLNQLKRKHPLEYKLERIFFG